MTDIILVGAGGCMRELAWQIMESNKILNEWNIVGYVDRSHPDNSSCVKVANTEIKYLGDDDYILGAQNDINVILSVGSPTVRRLIYDNYRKNSHVKFPNLVLKNAMVCSDIVMGQGCIISMGAKISTNVKLGDFVFVNMDATICHDGVIDDFVSINPAAKLAGAVSVGCQTEIGMGADIIQGTRVGKNVVIGAGAVVIRDTDGACTMVGVPARKVR